MTISDLDHLEVISEKAEVVDGGISVEVVVGAVAWGRITKATTFSYAYAQALQLPPLFQLNLPTPTYP
jgi:hypothetical protein